MNNISTILEGLNEEQRKAVQCVEGPVLIVAGAGSGKTRVLTSRVAYLLASGVDPSRVLALTFTKKAAGEMKERIAAMVGERSARRVVMGTFHSVFIRFLRDYAGSMGYPDNFTIYDTSDSVSCLKVCIRELGLDDKVYKPKEILSHISKAKNGLFTPGAYRASAEMMTADARAKKPRTCDIYELYQKKMIQAGVMDFDDILVNMNILLKKDSEALREISGRFSHILVDEYQDTNYAQYRIIKILAAEHSNVCVVGDDSQSIYAFRGAKIANILHFRKDYPQCRTFRLERNYRSTRNIVEAANSLIEHNEGRIPKTCYSEGDRGERIRIIKAYTEQEESVLIVSEIMERMRRDKAMYRDFAILYRTNSQSRNLEESLRRRNIPYVIYSGNSFFERAEVKDLMAYFKLAVNPNDDEAFRRVCNKPSRGIGETSFSALENISRTKGLSLFKAVFCEDFETFGLKAAAMQKIRSFCKLIDGFATRVGSENAHTLAVRIAEESGLYAYYKSDTSIEGMSRTANVEELLNSVLSFEEDRQEEGGEFTLDSYIENISLLGTVDLTDEGDDENKVTLMTVHSAKGLEFPYVFIAGMEENLFPNISMLNSRADIEEERRLFYVAVTRAERTVTLSFAATRVRNGKHESNPPSRFISEIDRKYFENPLDEEDFNNSGIRHEWGGFGSRFTGGRLDRFGGSREPMPSKSPVSYTPAVSSKPVMAAKPDIVDPDFIPVPMTELYAGERIEHNRFGPGTILEITGSVPELKAKVSFDGYGEKLLLLKYARMRPLKTT